MFPQHFSLLENSANYSPWSHWFHLLNLNKLKWVLLFQDTMWEVHAAVVFSSVGNADTFEKVQSLNTRCQDEESHNLRYGWCLSLSDHSHEYYKTRERMETLASSQSKESVSWTGYNASLLEGSLLDLTNWVLLWISSRCLILPNFSLYRHSSWGRYRIRLNLRCFISSLSGCQYNNSSRLLDHQCWIICDDQIRSFRSTL